MSLLRRWFGLTAPVDRRFYLLSGLGLMVVRCLGDSLIVLAMAGFKGIASWNPAIYISPFFGHRAEVIEQMIGSRLDANYAAGFMALWALPFAWVGVSMSMRRARDAGMSMWHGLTFLIPVINMLVIAALCVIPSRPAPPSQTPDAEDSGKSILRSAVAAIAWSGCFGVAVAILCVFILGDYGYALFVAGPVMMGAIGGWHVNRVVYRGYKAGIIVGLVSSLLCGALMVLLALEGVICMLMLAPLGAILVVMGSALGTGLAKAGSTPGPVSAMGLMLPIFGLMETTVPPPLTVYSVVSEIEIAAPPEEVWPNVVGFSELPPASDWVLKTGISTPMRARIEGQGVGAVRYCEFTTGPFVEPITAWEPPERLAFDVTEQPAPMHEWSPWEEVYAPHIEGTMLSQRGEFRLERTASGGTLLKGTTWYTIDLAPSGYWSLWSDFVVHRIHQRVLTHIKGLSEEEQGASTGANQG